MIVLGIDPGLGGAIALIDAKTGALAEIRDMPCLNDGAKGRRAVNAPLLSDLIWKAHAGHCFVEYVGARPGEGPAGAFSFGRSKGVIEGVCAAAGLPVTFLTPCPWKRAVGIPPGKDGAKNAARGEAIRRWPGKAELFAKKYNHGRAEAALIASAGLIKPAGNA
ncbi:hypothetical protein [Methylocystis sp.]|uniref:hypothetical protein n=1 Tax=Methylocystis sp. TaxID=1911079 RepID=UPI0025D5055C|nr:hypothetical protein [Methylocystis sp.]